MVMTKKKNKSEFGITYWICYDKCPQPHDGAKG